MHSQNELHIGILRFLPFVFFATCLLWFMIKKWDFIKEVLSDNGRGSSTRTVGFMFAIVVAINEVFVTMKTQQFDTKHLQYILITILLMFGLVKSTDLLAIWKGNSSTKQQENKPQTETK